MITWRPKFAWITGLLVVLVLVLIIGLYYRQGRTDNSFLTTKIHRGDIQTIIAATGTVEPEEVIDVGAQVAGRIVAFGKDKNGKPIDYGSEVEPGMVLAQIDDALYAADVAAAKAQLEQAKAAYQRAQADLGQLQAKLFQARRDWQRAQKLGPSEALSQADFDAAQSGFEIAQANLEVGKAAVVQARNAVQQAEAALRRAQQNLSYCTIRSPVKGVIIDRRVNIGQTVVSSLNAPSLFLIAKDLKRLQVWTAVNEADIGNIRPGQPVTFTVDAFPGETFTGVVSKIRLNAAMTQNVVTYTVEVSTDNPDGRLLPYLTANVRFLIQEKQGVLLVPNAALRYSPSPERIGSMGAAMAAHGKGSGAQSGAKAPAARLWLADGDKVKLLPVQVGLKNDTFTEISGPGVEEGLVVVVGERKSEQRAEAEGTSPFAPRLFKSGRGH